MSREASEQITELNTKNIAVKASDKETLNKEVANKEAVDIETLHKEPVHKEADKITPQMVEKIKLTSTFKQERAEFRQRKAIVASKNLKDRVIIIINDICYDVTDYRDHPGNDSIQIGNLKLFNLQDVTHYYNRYHCDSSSVADELLEQARVAKHPKIKVLGFSKDFFKLEEPKKGASNEEPKTTISESEKSHQNHADNTNQQNSLGFGFFEKCSIM